MEQIRSNISILSALLIFIGYLNYQFYYTNFDIEINSYLTTSELLFSFLPLTIPFLLIICTIIFLAMGFEFAMERKDKELDSEIETPLHAISRIPPAWRRVIRDIRRENKRAIDWLTLPISLLIFVMSIAVSVFMFAYIFIFFYVSTTLDFTTFDFAGTLILGVIWLIFVFIRIDLNEKQTTKKWYRSFGYALIITLSVGLLRLARCESALNILKGQAEYKALIDLNDSIISTDSKIVYIGQTSDYIFLRNLAKDENIIIKMDNIKGYTLTKLKKEKKTKSGKENCGL